MTRFNHCMGSCCIALFYLPKMADIRYKTALIAKPARSGTQRTKIMNTAKVNTFTSNLTNNRRKNIMKHKKRYAAWGHDGSFRFKWHRDLWAWWNRKQYGKPGA